MTQTEFIGKTARILHRAPGGFMRHIIAAAAIAIAFSVSAGTITSIDHPTIQAGSGEYFMTVTGVDLGDQFLYDGPTGRTLLDVNAVDGRGTVICWIPLDIVNTPGTYSLTVTGRAGDSGPVTFHVVKPGQPSLSLHLPEVLVATAKSRLGTRISYEFSVTGGDGEGGAKCDPVSGSTFPFGTSFIKCFAEDLSGGSASGEIQVNVWDGTAPVLTVPTSFEIPSEGDRGATVKYEVFASDAIDGELKPACSHESGAFLPNGRTVIRCEAIDLALNPAYGEFAVMVMPQDTGKLQLSLPADMLVQATNEFGAVVEYEVSAFGSADPDPVVECTPAAGNFFVVGETKVLCTAEDDFGSRVEGAFLVTVEAGSLKLEDVAAEATSHEGAVVVFEPELPESGEALVCSHDSGAFFAMGTTSVSCRSGSLSGSFDVTVADTVAPHIFGVRTVPGLIDSDQRVAVRVEVDAADAVDAMPRCRVSAIHGGEGHVTSDLTVSLRSGKGSASDFRLQITCTDKAGNRSAEDVPFLLGSGRWKATGN